MRFIMAPFVVFAILATSLVAQESVETFNSIRLEDPSTPGSYFTLAPASGMTPYRLVMPSSLRNRDSMYTFAVNGRTGSMVWYKVYDVDGSLNQVSFFSGGQAVRGHNNFTYDQNRQQLVLTSTVESPMFIMRNQGGIKTGDTVLLIQNNVTSSDAGAVATGLNIESHGTLSGAGSRNIGLLVSARNASSNVAAAFVNGAVGIGTATPNTQFDMTGDFATREINYTGNLVDGQANVEFTPGNRTSFVRIASSLAGPVTISGIAGGFDGKQITLYNATSRNVTVAAEGLTSLAQNRVRTPTDVDLVITPGAAYQLIYSGTEQRWRATFASPSDLTMMGRAEVTVGANNTFLPSNASYLRVKSTGGSQRYDVYLDNGTVPGQILVVENVGPKDIVFRGTNIIMDNAFNTMAPGDCCIFVWNGTKWVMISRASNA